MALEHQDEEKRQEGRDREAERERRVRLEGEYQARAWSRRSAWIFMVALLLFSFAIQPFVDVLHTLRILLVMTAFALSCFAGVAGFSSASSLAGSRFRYERTLGWVAFLLGYSMPLLSIMVPLIPSVRPDHHKKAQGAQGEVNVISMAARAYVHDHGRQPILGPGGDGAQSKAIIRILINAPPGNPWNTVYLELETNKTDGTFLDPYGTQYRILLDHDYDNKIHYNGRAFTTACIAISAGRDRRFGTADDKSSSR